MVLDELQTYMLFDTICNDIVAVCVRDLVVNGSYYLRSESCFIIPFALWILQCFFVSMVHVDAGE